MLIKRKIEIDGFVFGTSYDERSGVLTIGATRRKGIRELIEKFIEGFILLEEIPEPAFDYAKRIMKYKIELPLENSKDGHTPTYYKLIAELKNNAIVVGEELSSLGRLMR